MEYENTLALAAVVCMLTIVLILVLMEYENTVFIGNVSMYLNLVLILVLMEYENTACGLQRNDDRSCLNPCSNGIRKYKIPPSSKSIVLICLNPCSNGIRKY